MFSHSLIVYLIVFRSNRIWKKFNVNLNISKDNTVSFPLKRTYNVLLFDYNLNKKLIPIITTLTILETIPAQVLKFKFYYW